ncbi:glutathione S-transferase family protein [Microvirga splendida]|uniref:Glutathione S-transferase family protein n=1 Tax=Microvirga splendida TaxID=2795727 RepID=A0ABS0Y0H4_9HYPH|nr:glutathione S-transferase family protein [Microvirga splendida]MBJ6125448.1 glutathione S-transferase family protein [Microvirga splendida]
MPTRFELHGIALSGPTYKVGLLLTLSGEPFDYMHMNLRGGEHKQPGYLSKQRYGQVPLLVDRNNGRHLCQSAAILEYLADTLGKFGGATLDERLQAREWLYWDFDRLAPAIYRTRGIKAGFRKGGPEVLEMYAAEAQSALQVLDQHLAGRNWIVGEGVTIADIDIYGVLAYAGDAEIDLAPYPAVTAWMARFEALDGCRKPKDLLPMESRAAA